MADFPGGIPDRADLDRVVPDRPVYLESRDGHTAWVNSAALAAAGIDVDSLDPDGGRIERDADGRPIGALQEEAMTLVERLLPETTADELVAGLRLAQAELHALGHHPLAGCVGPARSSARWPTRRWPGRGELTGRVVGALLWDRLRGVEQLDELIERRARTAVGRYAPTSVKLFVDGVIESFTAAVLDPYLDAAGRPTAERGTSLIDPEALREAVVAHRCRRLPGACPRHRRAGGPRGARCGGRGPAGQRPGRHPPAHRPHPGHPSRRRAAFRPT